MGLDQYLYRINKMPEKYINIFKDTISEDQYNKLKEELSFYDDDNNFSLKYIDKKFISKCKYQCRFYDIKRALKEQYPEINIDNIEYVSREYYGDTMVMNITIFNDKTYRVEFKKDKVYTYLDTLTANVIYNEEIAYWRKAYYISDLVEKYTCFNHSDNNVTYIPLTLEIIQNIIQELTKYLVEGKEDEDLNMDTYSIANSIKEFREIITETDFDNQCLCYYEWY